MFERNFPLQCCSLSYDKVSSFPSHFVEYYTVQAFFITSDLDPKLMLKKNDLIIIRKVYTFIQFHLSRRLNHCATVRIARNSLRFIPVYGGSKLSTTWLSPSSTNCLGSMQAVISPKLSQNGQICSQWWPFLLILCWVWEGEQSGMSVRPGLKAQLARGNAFRANRSGPKQHLPLKPDIVPCKTVKGHWTKGVYEELFYTTGKTAPLTLSFWVGFQIRKDNP